jgi:hypothetical protein
LLYYFNMKTHSNNSKLVAGIKVGQMVNVLANPAEDKRYEAKLVRIGNEANGFPNWNRVRTAKGSFWTSCHLLPA